MKQYLKNIVEINDNRKSRIFAYFIQILIFVSILSFSFETVPDLEPSTRKILAILPFYLSLGVDLRSLRALRFLRLFRILKLMRYNKAIERFSRAISLAKEEVLLFLIVTLILIYFSAVGIYYFEHEVQPENFASIFDSLWWAIITLTTVGYGDVYPITVGGKVFTFFILMIGLGIVAIPTGIISSALTKSVDKTEEK